MDLGPLANLVIAINGLPSEIIKQSHVQIQHGSKRFKLVKMKIYLIPMLFAALFCLSISSCQQVKAVDSNLQLATSTLDNQPQLTSSDLSSNMDQPVCFETSLAPITFLPDSQRILLRAERGVRVFNIFTMQEELFLESPTILTSPAVALSPDGERLAWVLEDNSIQLIRILDKSTIFTANIHSGSITKLRFSPFGVNLFSASHDGWVKELDSQGELVNEFKPGGGEILGIDISADGKTMATIPFDGPVRLWDTANFQMVAELGGTGGYDTSDIAFSSNGQYVAADLATSLAVWDTTTQNLLWDGVNSIAFAFSPDGSVLAYSDISEGNDIFLTSPDGEQEFKVLSGHQGPVWEMIYSPDGQMLASTDGIDLRIWQVDDNELFAIGKSVCP